MYGCRRNELFLPVYGNYITSSEEWFLSGSYLLLALEGVRFYAPPQGRVARVIAVGAGHNEHFYLPGDSHIADLAYHA